MGAHLDGVQAAVLLILAVVGAAVHRALDGPVGGAGAVGVVVHGVISSLFPCIRLSPGIVWPDREGFIQGPPCAAGLFFSFDPSPDPGFCRRGLRVPAGLIRPSPGGRERNRVGPCYTRSRLASALSFAGLAQPRALGLLCPRRQSNQNAAGDTPDPVFSNRTLQSFDTRLPLNFRRAAGSS